MKTMFIINGSSRENGNTDLLTNLVVKGVSTKEVHLRTKHIIPITDKRHDPDGFQAVDDDYQEIVEEMLKHDTIIFATPLYWYGMSGLMKNFVDRWSQSLRDKSLNFADTMKTKNMYVLIVGGEHARLKALPLVQQFKLIFEFVGAKFEGYIIGEGNTPGAILDDEIALNQAKTLNGKLIKCL